MTILASWICLSDLDTATKTLLQEMTEPPGTNLTKVRKTTLSLTIIGLWHHYRKYGWFLGVKLHCWETGIFIYETGSNI